MDYWLREKKDPGLWGQIVFKREPCERVRQVGIPGKGRCHSVAHNCYDYMLRA